MICGGPEGVKAEGGILGKLRETVPRRKYGGKSVGGGRI